MSVETIIESFTNQLPSLAVTIAVIWTRLHYMEKKIDSLRKGFFRCRDHEKLEARVFENLKRRKNDPTD